jgi:hypothetical protein
MIVPKTDQQVAQQQRPSSNRILNSIPNCSKFVFLFVEI